MSSYPDTYESRLREIERRLRTMETAPRIMEASSLTIRNDGDRKVIPAGSGGNLALFIGDGGWNLPALNGHWAKPNNAVGVTSSTFSGCWATRFHRAEADAFEVSSVIWVTDPGTVGELRIINEIVGGGRAAAVVLPAGSSGAQRFAWEHGQPIGTGPFLPRIQARRVSGAGNVWVYEPDGCWQAGSERIGATTGGV